MQFIYPRQRTRIFVPLDLDGRRSRTVFEVAHRRPETVIHWHLDNEYLGSTATFHQFELNPEPGKYLLVLVDENGARLEQYFEVLHK
jgi:penicillin-binding protein 1C